MRSPKNQTVADAVAARTLQSRAHLASIMRHIAEECSVDSEILGYRVTIVRMRV